MGYYLWDQPYYNRVMLEKAYQVDQQTISEYFELHTVVDRMLGIFSDLFGLKFTIIDGENRNATGRPDLWHDDVQVFIVHDGDDDGALLGWLYMDLYERNGKKSSACNFNLVPVGI
jgi:metallopeptidase MepB